MSDSIIFLFINNQHDAHNLVSWAFDCDRVGLIPISNLSALVVCSFYFLNQSFYSVKKKKKKWCKVLGSLKKEPKLQKTIYSNFKF